MRGRGRLPAPRGVRPSRAEENEPIYFGAADEGVGGNFPCDSTIRWAT